MRPEPACYDSGIASPRSRKARKHGPPFVPNDRSPSRGAWSPFSLGVDLGLGVALTIFLGASFAAYDLARQAVQAASEARASLEALAAIQEVLTSVVDAETGQRGYLLTGDDRYLEAYGSALPQIQDHLAGLRLALAGQPAQSANLDALGRAVREKLAELEQTLAQSRSAGTGAARGIGSMDQGRVAMDKIRALARDISTQERATLRGRNEAASHKLLTARGVVVGGVLIDLFVLLGISLITHREIRTRARAEEALEIASADAQEVLDASTQVSIIATDLRGRITLFNRGAEEMLGYDAREMVGRESLQILHLASELEARGRENSAATGVPVSGFDVLTEPIRHGIREEEDWIYLRKGGGQLTVTLSITAKHDQRGALSGYLAIARDVSEERRVDRRQAVQHAATQALSESVTFEDAIPRTLEALGRGLGFQVLVFWVVHPQSETLRPASCWCASDRFEAFAQASRALTLGRDQDLAGRVWARGAPAWAEDLAQNEASFSRAPAARAAGLRTGFACPVALGGDVMAVVEVFRETKEPHDPWVVDLLGGIGAQIAQFMERDAADLALRASDERTKAIIENMLEGLIVVDQRTFIVSVNRAAERMFGYESWELVGQHLALLVPVPATVTQTEAFLKEARLRSVGRITEWKGRRKNGDLFPFELSLYEFDTPEGRLFAGHVRDISERLRLDRMKKEFVATVSHELRTPLTSIRGSLSLLSSGVLGSLPDEAMDVVAIAERNTLRLITLINDILDLERLESGQMEVQIVPTSLRTVVDRALEAVRSFANEEGVALVSSVPEIQVLGDGDRLVQVLVNLLSNAVKFSERGLSVAVEAEGRDGDVLVRVVDRGRGIPAAALARLFQRFQQVEASDSRQKGGTGLGLAICKVIIEQHDGEIGVDSEPGRGSTFWFRVPSPRVEGEMARALVLADVPAARRALTHGTPCSRPCATKDSGEGSPTSCWWTTIKPSSASWPASSSPRASRCGSRAGPRKPSRKPALFRPP
jgi:PAS domain S-box-containing protein